MEIAFWVLSWCLAAVLGLLLGSALETRGKVPRGTHTESPFRESDYGIDGDMIGERFTSQAPGSSVVGWRNPQQRAAEYERRYVELKRKELRDAERQ